MTQNFLDLIHSMVLVILEHENLPHNVTKLKKVLAAIEEALFESD